jgi:hypothetical protein
MKHKIDFVYLSSIGFKWCFSNRVFKLPLEADAYSAATVGLKENSFKTSFAFLLLLLLRCNSRSSTHKTTLKAV